MQTKIFRTQQSGDMRFFGLSEQLRVEVADRDAGIFDRETTDFEFWEMTHLNGSRLCSKTMRI